MIEIDKEKLRSKFTEIVSEGIIFYKQPFLPHEVNYIFDCIDKIEKILNAIEHVGYVGVDCPEDGIKLCAWIKQIMGLPEDE